jgi:hypothetical protein
VARRISPKGEAGGRKQNLLPTGNIRSEEGDKGGSGRIQYGEIASEDKQTPGAGERRVS